MTNVARLFTQGGILTYDADVPYDRQLLFEDANQYAKRQGSIRLDLDGVHWTVRASMVRSPRCTHCGGRVPALSYTDRRRLLCPRCARTLCLVPRLSRGPADARKAPRRKDGVSRHDGQRRPPWAAP